MDLEQEVERLREIRATLDKAQASNATTEGYREKSRLEATKRDSAIYKLSELGLTHQKIADELGMTSQRVTQIVQAARRRDPTAKSE